MINKSDAEVKLKVTADSNSAQKGLKNLGAEAKNTQNNFSNLEKVGNAVFKGLVIGIGATATAIGGLVTKAVQSYADFEQLEGGVETLFKDSADVVMKNAKKAYKTAGMSANAYMESVTSFSASLLQSLGGDTKKAAQVADMALVDMSDNANKMGTSMELIQNAYQGFSKQNYTMLDNLKLGYGGTKTEMERLLKDAQKITGVKYDINNLNDVFQAIHVIQKELDITGTTSKEATTTISGSINMVKAAFDNFLNGSGSPEELAEAIEIAFTNIGNAVAKIGPAVINGLVKLIDMLAPKIPPALQKLLPPLIDGVKKVIASLINVLPNELKGVLAVVLPLITAFATITKVASLIKSLKSAFMIFKELVTIIKLVSTAFKLLGAVMMANPIMLIIAGIIGLVAVFVLLWNKCEWFRNFWIGLWEGIKSGALAVVNWFKNLPQEISNLVTSIINFLKNLPNYLAYMFGWLLGRMIKFYTQDIPNFINNIIKWLVKFYTQDIPNFINNVIKWFLQLPGKVRSIFNQVITTVGQWITNMYNKSKSGISNLVKSIINWFKTLPSNMMNIGKNIVQGLWKGITGLKDWVVNKVKGLGKSIIKGMKSALGIHSPSVEFAILGKYSVLGFEEGLEDNEKELHRTIEDTIGLDFLKNGSVNVSNMYGNLTPNITNNQPIYVNVEADMDVDKFGRAFVNDIKVFSGGAKNSFNYGGGK